MAYGASLVTPRAGRDGQRPIGQRFTSDGVMTLGALRRGRTTYRVGGTGFGPARRFESAHRDAAPLPGWPHRGQGTWLGALGARRTASGRIGQAGCGLAALGILVLVWTRVGAALVRVRRWFMNVLHQPPSPSSTQSSVIPSKQEWLTSARELAGTSLGRRRVRPFRFGVWHRVITRLSRFRPARRD
jgi:hypothetical protein